MVTSTPNPWIEKCSEKYGIPLEINTGEKGITRIGTLHIIKRKQNLLRLPIRMMCTFPDILSRYLRG